MGKRVMKSAEFRRIRKDKLQMTQAELAEVMGMSQQAINRLENERRPTGVQAAFIRYIAEHRQSAS